MPEIIISQEQFSSQKQLEAIMKDLDGESGEAFATSCLNFFTSLGVDIATTYTEAEQRLSRLGLEDEFTRWKEWQKQPLDAKRKPNYQLDIESHPNQDERYANFYLRVFAKDDQSVYNVCPGQCSADMNELFYLRFQRDFGADLAEDIGFVQKMKGKGRKEGPLQYYFWTNSGPLIVSEEDGLLQKFAPLFVPTHL